MKGGDPGLWERMHCGSYILQNKLMTVCVELQADHMYLFSQAGATSMWASCCGLLNEVMGTGAVRGQQPGFGGGANPFRFAPSTDFTVYTSSAAGGANVVCKACGLSFSVFRKRVSSPQCPSLPPF